METDMARAAGSMRQSLAGISGSSGGRGKALAGGFLGGIADGGLTNSRQAAKSLADIGNGAKRAGLSAQAKYVAETNRISIDAVVDGFKELSLRADEFITTGVGPAAEAFGRLGFRVAANRRSRALSDRWRSAAHPFMLPTWNVSWAPQVAEIYLARHTLVELSQQALTDLMRRFGFTGHAGTSKATNVSS